jgi:putative SOS response-associated peptidase YedK
MCSNFALTITSQQAANEYGVLFSQETEQQYFPYHPNKALDPPKPYSLPNVVYFDADGRRDVRQMRWGLLRSTAKKYPELEKRIEEERLKMRD